MAVRGRRPVDPVAGIDDGLLEAALARGFPVRLIATTGKLVTLEAGEPLGAALARPELAGFDHLPVTRDGRIVGLLQRADLAGAAPPAGLVGEVARGLDETRLITADAGILTFLEAAGESPCRLVLEGGRIIGIVTRSDLQKLPVRALLFTLTTRLELLMMAWIRACFQEDAAWLSRLAEPRREAILERHGRHLAANQAIDPLTATMLADKREVILASAALPYGKGRAEAELERIEALRDSLAHSGDLALSAAGWQGLIETVALTRRWIALLPTLPLKAEA